MGNNDKFSFAELRSVAAWGFRAAWKIDGPRMILWSLILLAGSVLPAFLMGQSAKIVDTVVSRLGTANSLEAVIWPLVLAALCMYGASLYYLLPELLHQYMQARYDKGSFHMMIDEINRIPVPWFDNPEFTTQLDLYKSSQNITWLVLGAVRVVGSAGVVISLLVLSATVALPIFLILLALAVLTVIQSVRNSIRDFQHWYSEGDAKKRIDYFKQTLTASWYAKDIRVLSAAPRLLDLWKKDAWAALERRRLHDNASSRQWDKVRALGFVTQAAILACALVLLWQGALSLGSLVMFTSLAFSMPGALSRMGVDLVRPLFSLRTNRAWKKFFDVDWAGTLPVPPAAVAGIPADTVIEPGLAATPDLHKTAVPVFDLTGVCYQYSSGTYALKDVSLKVMPGEIIALVGHNGAGKSTLTKILLGFYTPTSGSIFFRGKPYTRELVDSLTGEIGATFQDFRRFELSIRENVAFGNIEHLHDDPVLVQALQTGGGEGILAKAEGNLDRYVGGWYTDDGLGLSGGEWQRLATCRAYVNERPIFVMDEPASMLDPVAEIQQFEALRNNLGKRTAILVSHRIGFARLANRIAVLDKGELVELGSHEELMGLGGHYHTLFTAQAEWYDHDSKAAAPAAIPGEAGK